MKCIICRLDILHYIFNETDTFPGGKNANSKKMDIRSWLSSRIGVALRNEQQPAEWLSHWAGKVRLGDVSQSAQLWKSTRLRVGRPWLCCCAGVPQRNEQLSSQSAKWDSLTSVKLLNNDKPIDEIRTCDHGCHFRGTRIALICWRPIKVEHWRPI